MRPHPCKSKSQSYAAENFVDTLTLSLFNIRLLFISESGLSGGYSDLIMKWFMVFCFLLSVSDADILHHPVESQALSPAVGPNINLPSHHKPHLRSLSHYGSPTTMATPPASSVLLKHIMKKNASLSSSPELPSPGSTEISPISGATTMPAGLSQPPISPHTSNCCKGDMVLKRGTQGCNCVYPIKLDLLLLNVSSSPNWNFFLEQFSTQLGLEVSQIELINFYVLSSSRLNISMDLTPHARISFSSREAAKINSSLSTHKVRMDPSLVGDYQLLNITWFEPPPQSQAPVSALAPVEAHPRLPSTPAAIITSNKKSSPNLVLVIGILAGILTIVIILLLIICSCLSRKAKRVESKRETDIDAAKPRSLDAVPASAGSLPHPTSTRFLSFEELKEATNNFALASILGEGGFGKVFKGVLKDGTLVAIKRLTSGGQQGNKEFLVEVEMLSRLHHRNLVKLVGYYSNRDCSQNLLCYELVPNGTLEAWLHAFERTIFSGPLGVDDPLDWDTRMKIALDAARGLAYLHEDSQPCVIHRDFKASNILLENNFNAKVADFGLAKQAPEGRTNYLSTRVMGTFGYVAPEYAMTGHLLVKSDVYSYGVVLLELLTGRKPVDMSQPSGQENLVTWARPIIRDKDRLEELADARLEGRYPKEDFIRVCTIAAACVAPEASQRPTMGEVVQSLKMVQRTTEYQVAAPTSNARPNNRQSSTTFESDGTSSIFSSGPYSGLSVFDNDNISRTAVFSEDLHEGR
ncbi:hypothetical protein LIER_01983 [Lithospermum erythrorhizon]|uniref:Protein kinase domain-containing protein n=1 Tax=Lithospermum erythrorhizon TaxID=34254 RepID=A0AAV3NMV7_LITER